MNISDEGPTGKFSFFIHASNCKTIIVFEENKHNHNNNNHSTKNSLVSNVFLTDRKQLETPVILKYINFQIKIASHLSRLMNL